MWRDPIVEEVRAHRAALAAEHGNDLKTLIAALRRKQSAGGRRVVSFAAKRESAKPARRKAG
jgi:hypothetical protein